MIPVEWSAGDLITGVGALVKVVKAFKAVGGASDKYESRLAFIEGLQKTFERLRQLINDENDNVPQDIEALLAQLDKPWKEFRKFLEKYDTRLDEASNPSKTKHAAGIISWTAKELSGKVEELEHAIAVPLKSLEVCLTVQGLYAMYEVRSLLKESSARQENNLVNMAQAIQDNIATQFVVAQEAYDENLKKELGIIETILSDGISDLKSTLRLSNENRTTELSTSTQTVLDALEQTSTDPMALTKTLEEVMSSVTFQPKRDEKTVDVEEPATRESQGHTRSEAHSHSQESRFIEAVMKAGQIAALLVASVIGGLIAAGVQERSNKSMRANDLLQNTLIARGNYETFESPLPHIQRQPNPKATSSANGSIEQSRALRLPAENVASNTAVSKWVNEWKNSVTFNGHWKCCQCGQLCVIPTTPACIECGHARDGECSVDEPCQTSGDQAQCKAPYEPNTGR